jgi:anti-sigma factor ChrR (cupin superfamily)
MNDISAAALSQLAQMGRDPNKSVRFPDKSVIVRCETLPWTPWALKGSWFKLLYINRSVSMSVALIKIDKGTQTPDHFHFGEAHAYVLQGNFGYEHGLAFKGDHLVEGGGIAHKPVIGPDEDLITFSIFFGGLGGVKPDGTVDGCCGCDAMYEMAAANGAADHLEPPPDKRY